MESIYITQGHFSDEDSFFDDDGSLVGMLHVACDEDDRFLNKGIFCGNRMLELRRNGHAKTNSLH